MSDFSLESYDYTLPKELIASYPASPLESAKLLVYNRATQEIIHSNFYHFSEFIPVQTLIVCNDTKVLNARIYALKNAKLFEIFYHKCIDSNKFIVQIRGKVKQGDKLILKDDTSITIHILELLEDGMRKVCFKKNNLILNLDSLLKLLESFGQIPLPPYIKRGVEKKDFSNYQSVFAKISGSVAAPTASLHFSEDSFNELKRKFEICFITLHIGAGTFKSVESSDIRGHKIHSEAYSIDLESAKKIKNANKVLCIGTTAARCVEYFAKTNNLNGECNLFIYPSVAFEKVDYLLTNFHLPKSTLLMLVSAMIGREKTLEIYANAIEKGYKFYSYGDGMLIL